MSVQTEVFTSLLPVNSQVPLGLDGQNGQRELALLAGEHRERPYAEAFVQEVFFRSYQARLSQFYPLLLAIRSQHAAAPGNYDAVAGARPALNESLFLENYLSGPVEAVLGVERSRIIEIGNLAPANAGQARWLITAVNAFMVAAGFTHVVFTAVPRLKNAFSRMGLPLTELARATIDALPEEQQVVWGSYYQADPRVYVGDLRLGEQRLATMAASDDNLRVLCQRADYVGHQLGQALRT